MEHLFWILLHTNGEARRTAQCTFTLTCVLGALHFIYLISENSNNTEHLSPSNRSVLNASSVTFHLY